VIAVDASSIAKVVLQEEGARVPLSVDAATLDYSYVEVANPSGRLCSIARAQMPHIKPQLAV
jgi:hypothetical protein